MGLGLYIAREIATAHGGDIAAKSDEMKPFSLFDYEIGGLDATGVVAATAQ